MDIPKPSTIEFWYLVRKLEQRLIGQFEGGVKGKKALKKLLIGKQNAMCGLAIEASCDKELDGQIELDRIDTRWNFDPDKNFGYFDGNCRAVHAGCHRRIKEERDKWDVPTWVKERREQLFKEVDRLLRELSIPPTGAEKKRMAP
jgi:hypothetical protein